MKAAIKRMLGLSKPRSVSPRFFDTLYRDSPDPFNYESSDYESKKYARTLSALPRPSYERALEIGGSIGVLTELLAPRCGSLLSIDVSELAQQRARERCRNLPHVRFEIVRVPREYPNGSFDLTLFSEVGYYLSLDDLKKTRGRMIQHMTTRGHLLMVHWTKKSPAMPLTGAQVHEVFQEETGKSLRHVEGSWEPGYRIDLFEKI